MNCVFDRSGDRLICRNCHEEIPYVDGMVFKECLPIGSPKLPSLASQVIHFGRDMANWAMAGCPINTQSEHDRRLAICKGCERFDGQKCRECGCICSWSTWLDTKQCPLGKW